MKFASSLRRILFEVWNSISQTFPEIRLSSSNNEKYYTMLGAWSTNNNRARKIEFHLAFYFICAQLALSPSHSTATFFKRMKLPIFKSPEITKANNLLQLSRVALNYICHIMNTYLNAISNKLISKMRIRTHSALTHSETPDAFEIVLQTPWQHAVLGLI